MIARPKAAFQNPTTVQGRVAANNTVNTKSTKLKPPAERAKAISQIIAAMVPITSVVNSSRRPSRFSRARVVPVRSEFERSSTR
jgi:hypothetical protein